MSVPTTTLAQLTNRVRSQPVRIKIIDKQPKQENPTKVSYQRLVFQDKEGTKMTATLFGLDIEVYGDILLRGHFYDIKNMLVRDVPPRFASYAGERQLYFTNSTSVIPAGVVGQSSKQVSPYTLLKDIPEDASVNDRFDMILLVLHVHPEKMVAKGECLLPVREMSVSDPSVNDMLLLSAWNKRMIEKFNQIELLLLEDPVVEITGLKISRFAGFSLATSLSTEVKLHSSCAEATTVREWVKNNPEVVKSRIAQSLLIEATGYPNEITSIAAALSMQPASVTEAHILRVRVHIPEIRYEAVRLTVGCRACGKASLDDNVTLQQDYHCAMCSVVNKPEAKMYFRFKCTDGTSTLTLDAYTKSAERLLEAKSEEYHAKSDEDRRSVLAGAEARYRANTVDLLIGPAKPLLINNNRLKWILIDVGI